MFSPYTEVVGTIVFDEMVTRMPGYQFHITEGPQTQEILVGVKKSFTSFFTQKTEFKSGAAMLRPGALLTLRIDGENYPLLFLHLKSLTVPKGFGLRDDMTERAIDFRKTLNRADAKMGGSGQANFLFLGDLNTMGMNLTYSNKDISGVEKIERLQKRLAPRNVAMRILEKSHGMTYWPGSGSKYSPSDLDHMVAADHLSFKNFGGVSVDVRGWVDEPSDAKKDAWAKKFSDHAILYCEIQKG
ncbi:MAG: hypothetical protein OEW33_08315 [Nitrospirota bacterium]|nr:hypothetical protein [Nitrospirota bacterium]MDH4360727.1 hypothetical protein [Nitrospirota bacterium]